MTELSQMQCKACSGDVPSLTSEQAMQLQESIPAWELNEQSTIITRTFAFKNYYKTIAFVNAIAWMAHSTNHHPDLLVSYNKCTVSYMTHAIGALSENDFICAAKVDEIFNQLI